MDPAKRLHHLGIAVNGIEEQRAFYEGTLGAVCEGIEEVPDQHVRVAFFRMGNDHASTLIELLEPTADESTIAKHLAKRGPGLHHVAYEVSDLEDSLRHLKTLGVKLIDEHPRPGAHNMMIAFLNPASTGGVLTELCQTQD